MNTPGVISGVVWSPDDQSKIVQIKVETSPGSGLMNIHGECDETFLQTIEVATEAIRFSEKIKLNQFDTTIHLPCPIIGASIGLPLALALYSSIKNIFIKSDIAFTGELSTLGNVISVSEIASKMHAVSSAQLQTFVFPFENLIDLPNIVDIQNITNLILCPTRSLKETILSVIP